MSSDNNNGAPFWVWMIVLGTLSIGVSLAIEKSDVGEAPKADAVAGVKTVAKVVTTNYSSYYLQSIDYLCSNEPKQMAVVSTVRSEDVLVVEKSNGHIYNIAAFNKKFGHCVPIGVGVRRTTSLMVDTYYNAIIDKLYPNNVR